MTTVKLEGTVLIDNIDKLIHEWLATCPLPVVGRIIDDTQDLISLGISTPLYEEQTLVVIPLETLYQLVRR